MKTITNDPQGNPNASSKSTTTTTTKVGQYQFIRQEGYSRVKSGRQLWSASQVIDEALRVAANCKHVVNPMPPIAQYGVHPQDLAAALNSIKEKAERIMVDTARGKRRQRSDTLILIALVASYPLPPSERIRDEVQNWIRQTIEWLIETYGADNLMCVLEHIDEGYIHLHAYVHNHGRSVKPLMAGHRERLSAIAAKLPASEVREAYRNAMIRFQDDYHAKVCAPLGLERKSPAPRPRLSRPAYFARQRDEIAIREEQLEISKARLKEEEDLMRSKQAELDELANRLRQRESTIDAALHALAMKRQRLANSLKTFRRAVRTMTANFNLREWSIKSAEAAIAASQDQLTRRWAAFQETFISAHRVLGVAQKKVFKEGIKRLLDRR